MYDATARDLVGQCWDKLRWCMAYDLYFGDILSGVSRTNFWLEIVVAGAGTGSIGASGGVIAGWTFWQTGLGAVIWALFGGFAAIAAWSKPFLKLDQEIESYSKRQQAYRILQGSLDSLILSVQKEKQVTADHWDRFAKISESMNDEYQKWPPKINNGRLEQFQDQVNVEKPPKTLWMPTVADEKTQTEIKEEASRPDGDKEQ
jgi:hypothetical protein